MRTTSLAKQLLGIVVLLVGCVLLLASLRRLLHISEFWKTGNPGLILWNVAGFVVLIAVGVYCFLSALRLLNSRLVKKPRFGWGRIVLGSFMLYVQIGSDLHLVPDGPVPTFKPSNPAEAATMKMTGIALCFAFAYVIYRGIRVGFARPESPESTPELGAPGSRPGCGR